MARPKLNIDPKVVTGMAAIGCTCGEIASVLGCSVDTLERRFADIIEKGRSSGKTRLRRLQWQAAEGGNVTMMIWLGKQLLGQRDNLDVATTEKPPTIIIERYVKPSGAD